MATAPEDLSLVQDAERRAAVHLREAEKAAKEGRLGRFLADVPSVEAQLREVNKTRRHR